MGLKATKPVFKATKPVFKATKAVFKATKPVFEVSDKVSHKPVSSATETCQKIEISLVAHLDMILSNKQITKAR